MSYWQIVIRNAADTADDLVMSSVPGDPNEYLIAEPDGDGQTLDVFTSTVDQGDWTVQVGDPDTGGGVRPITTRLKDAALKWTLLSRVAYVRWKAAIADPWTTQIAGYQTGIVQDDALAFTVSIGQAGRRESEAVVYDFLTPKFGGGTGATMAAGTSLIGGPVRGLQNLLGPDKGGWRFAVEAASGDIVRLNFKFGQVREDESAYHNQVSDVSYKTFRRINRRAQPFRYRDGREGTSPYTGYYYPDLVVKLYNPATGALVGDFTAIASDVRNSRTWIGVSDIPYLLFTRNEEIRIVWDVATYGAQPAIGTAYTVYVESRVVNETFPLHVRGHPVDIEADHLDEKKIPYDAATRASVKAALGPIVLSQRPTEPTKLVDLSSALHAAFGYARRLNPATGRYEFFATRQLPASIPATTYTVNDLGEATSLFDHQEGSLANQVRFTVQQIVPWTAEDPDDPSARPLDDLAVFTDTFTVNPEGADHPAEQDRFGVHAVEIDVPGMIGSWDWVPRAILTTGTKQFPPASAAARQIIYDMGGLRGVPEGELDLIGVTPPVVGQDVTLNIAYDIRGDVYPAVRGGSRVVRILQSVPHGQATRVRFRDMGYPVTVATAPTITLAANAARPRNAVVATITNAAALAAAGVQVRLEYVQGGAVAPTANGAEVARVDPATVTTVGLPEVDGGSIVWVRAQSLRADQQPSAYSAWASIDLADLPAPTLLALATVASDGTALDATWTVGDAALRVEVRVRANATEPATRPVATLPAASTRYRLTGLTPGALHTVEVRHVDDPPLGGVSAVASATATTTGAPALTAPEAPAVFAGSYTDETGQTAPITEGGTYGLDVTATVFPSTTEVEEAVETAVGSGTPGAYALVAALPSNDAGRTRYVATAPNDGLRRYLRARHRVVDTVSAYTTALSVNPWGRTQAPLGPRDRLAYVEIDGVQTFSAKASDADGLALDPEARTRDTAGDRPVMRGYQSGEARNGDAITFSPVFQGIPRVRLSANRAITHEPRAKYNASGDGTGATAYQSAKQTIADLVALNVSASGCTIRARLRQPDATITTRQHNFAANTLTAVGQTAALTLANAPANNDQYAAQFTASVGGAANSGVVNITLTVAVDTYDDATLLWTERATGSYTHTEIATEPSPGPTLYTDWLTATVSGLTAADQLRVRVKAISVVGDGTASVSVTAHTGVGAYTAPGVQYTTSAAADLYASMTPASDVAAVIDWEAFEVRA